MSTSNFPLYYYAYGSNLVTARLAERTGGATPLGRATLSGHVLRFHKVSTDETAKADARFTGRAEDEVIGVLFSIPATGKRGLDRAEGLGHGYSEKNVRVVREDGSAVDAFTYVADDSAIGVGLRPAAWYREMVILGALEQGLPAGYIDRFMRSVPVVHKPRPEPKAEPKRKTRQRPAP